MSTQSSRAAARLMLSPTVILLLIWMIVPLVLTLWFSTQRYNLLYPDRSGFNWFQNYTRFVATPGFLEAIGNTLIPTTASRINSMWSLTNGTLPSR